MGISFKKQLEQEENFFKLYKFTCQLPMKQSYMLSYLIDADDFVNYRLADDLGYFMCCKAGFINKMLTGWSNYQITSAIDELVEEGYVYKRVENIDGKNITYIKLNIDAINELNTNYKNLCDQQQKFEGCNTKKLYVIKNNKIKNNNQTIIYSVESLSQLEELDDNDNCTSCISVDDEYTAVKRNTTNRYTQEIKEIISYLNDKINSRYRTTTESCNRLIRARLNENYTVEDFKKVIDKKYNEWYNTDMCKYLRPQTLFGSKFDTYLNQQSYVNPHKEIQRKVVSSTAEDYARADEFRRINNKSY